MVLASRSTEVVEILSTSSMSTSSLEFLDGSQGAAEGEGGRVWSSGAEEGADGVAEGEGLESVGGVADRGGAVSCCQSFIVVNWANVSIARANRRIAAFPFARSKTPLVWSWRIRLQWACSFRSVDRWAIGWCVEWVRSVGKDTSRRGPKGRVNRLALR